jgi:hypothetical protein
MYYPSKPGDYPEVKTGLSGSNKWFRSPNFGAARQLWVIQYTDVGTLNATLAPLDLLSKALVSASASK